MSFKLGKKSQKILNEVHPDLALVIREAIKISNIDFCVLEGLRSVERQKKLVQSGASKTMNSRHLTGHAVDIGAMIDGVIHWDWPLYDIIAHTIKSTASDLRIPIIWGGDWETFKDGPHFELDRRKYP